MEHPVYFDISLYFQLFVAKFAQTSKVSKMVLLYRVDEIFYRF